MSNEVESSNQQTGESEVSSPKKSVWNARWFKMLRRVLGITVVVLVIAIFAFIYFLGSTIKAVVEEFGSTAFKNKTTVEKVDVSLLRGVLLIENLVVGNPRGYNSEHAIYLGRIYVKVDVSSVFSDEVHVTMVDIDDPQFIYELGGIKESNISVLMKNLQQHTGADKKKQDAPVPQKNEKKQTRKSSGKTVIVDRVEIDGAKVTLAAKLLGGNGAPVALPSIVLNDLGKEKKLSIVDATVEIVTKTLTSVTNVGASSSRPVIEGIKSLFSK